MQIDKCNDCGGVKYFTYDFTNSLGITTTIISDVTKMIKICSCSCPPASESKHNGNLDKHGYCRVSFADTFLDTASKLITLHHPLAPDDWASFALTPTQFLSLMEWGKQNRAQIEQLAKE